MNKKKPVLRKEPVFCNEYTIKDRQRDFYDSGRFKTVKRGPFEFIPTHFAKENYERLVRFISEYERLIDVENVSIICGFTNFDLTCVTPLELRLLGDSPAFSSEMKNGTLVLDFSDELSFLISTRKYGAMQENSVRIIREFPYAENFGMKAFKGAYIDQFEMLLCDLCEKGLGYFNLPSEFYDFDPVFYEYLREHLDKVFEKGTFYPDGKINPFIKIELSSDGKDLLRLSEKVSAEKHTILKWIPDGSKESYGF